MKLEKILEAKSNTAAETEEKVLNYLAEHTDEAIAMSETDDLAPTLGIRSGSAIRDALNRMSKDKRVAVVQSGRKKFYGSATFGKAFADAKAKAEAAPAKK